MKVMDVKTQTIGQRLKAMRDQRNRELEQEFQQAKAANHYACGCKPIPLMTWINWAYKDHYVKLCYLVGEEPLSLGKWLLKPVGSVK